jgi:hypothetical protein
MCEIGVIRLRHFWRGKTLALPLQGYAAWSASIESNPRRDRQGSTPRATKDGVESQHHKIIRVS